MNSILEFFVNKIQISEGGSFIELDTTILFTSELDNIRTKKEEGIHRSYCNFVITYDEYLRLHLKVGDSIKVNISRIIPHVKH